MKIKDLDYQTAKNSGFPFNRSVYKDDFYIVDNRGLDCAERDLSQRNWTDADLISTDWIINVSDEFIDLEIKLKEKQLNYISEADHAILRIAVMRSDLNLIRKLNYIDSRLIKLFDNLAMTIAIYHGKTNVINLLKKICN